PVFLISPTSSINPSLRSDILCPALKSSSVIRSSVASLALIPRDIEVDLNNPLIPDFIFKTYIASELILPPKFSSIKTFQKQENQKCPTSGFDQREEELLP